MPRKALSYRNRHCQKCFQVHLSVIRKSVESLPCSDLSHDVRILFCLDNAYQISSYLWSRTVSQFEMQECLPSHTNASLSTQFRPTLKRTWLYWALSPVHSDFVGSLRTPASMSDLSEAKYTFRELSFGQSTSLPIYSNMTINLIPINKNMSPTVMIEANIVLNSHTCKVSSKFAEFFNRWVARI